MKERAGLPGEEKGNKVSLRLGGEEKKESGILEKGKSGNARK